MNTTAMGWAVFGIAVWAIVIFLKALQNRFAPELNENCSSRGTETSHGGGASAETDQDAEEDSSPIIEFDLTIPCLLVFYLFDKSMQPTVYDHFLLYFPPRKVLLSGP